MVIAQGWNKKYDEWVPEFEMHHQNPTGVTPKGKGPSAGSSRKGLATGGGTAPLGPGGPDESRLQVRGIESQASNVAHALRFKISMDAMLCACNRFATCFMPSKHSNPFQTSRPCRVAVQYPMRNQKDELWAAFSGVC